MRIAEISTLSHSVPPRGEGSVEMMVAQLCRELTHRGHQVTLYATADSKTVARLRSPVETSYNVDPQKWDWQIYEAHQAQRAFQDWRDFDVIHSHAYHFGLLFCDFVPVPSLHSVHIEPGPDYRFLARSTTNRHLHFASRFQARDFTDVSGVHVVPHAIDAALFPLRKRLSPDAYLAFLGRFIPEKGPLEAIQFARKTGLPLKLAAPHNDYFESEIRRHIDDEQIQYVGELDESSKIEFLRNASALLYPVQRGEPFGLVLIEAMMCGLPVLALNRGAVPEIIEHGRTGFVAETLDELVDHVRQIDLLDPLDIREYAIRNFSLDAWTTRLERIMLQIVEASR